MSKTSPVPWEPVKALPRETRERLTRDLAALSKVTGKSYDLEKVRGRYWATRFGIPVPQIEIVRKCTHIKPLVLYKDEVFEASEVG